jgi:uncharacterized YkwD family protein
MLKKVSVGLALSATLLFGGVLNTSANAAANENQSKAQPYKVYFSIDGNWKDFSWNNLNDLFSKFGSKKWSKIEWDNTGQKKQQKEDKKEQPKVEQPKPEEPVKEQPKVEQPKQEQPKQEQPVQQAPVQPETPKQEEKQSQGQSQLSQFEREVVELTNNERTKNGLSPFQIDEELSKVAREKSRDMSAKNYFDHNSPTYGSPFDMMKAYGISYRAAGENIAKGQRTPQEVVKAWMDSPGHRANILNSSFTHIGVGFVEQGNHWTQMFIGK